MHSALERGLLERLGPSSAASCAPAASRNDQIATDLRLYLRDHAAGGRRLVLDAGAGAAPTRPSAHVDVADARHDPPAARPAGAASATTCSPTRWPLLRDVDRLRDWDARGRGLARTAPARSPGRRCRWTRRRSPPSSASTAPRDELDRRTRRPRLRRRVPFVAALIGVHLSRLGEEVVLWRRRSSAGSTLDDAFSTGSSIMPQKKNPDIAELARGKSGRLIGDLTGLLATLKGLPLAYNRDLQEDKEPVFDAVDTAAAPAAALSPA